jgi:hypothetical protein
MSGIDEHRPGGSRRRVGPPLRQHAHDGALLADALLPLDRSRPPLQRRRTHRLWLLLAVPFVAGCGSETVDATEVEQQIQAQLSTATAEVVSVSCPEDVTKEEGASFECKAKLEGGGKAVVVVNQGERNEFSYTAKKGTVQLADDSLEPYLEKQLKAKGVSAQVDCPALSRVKAGETVTCSATTSGGRQTTLAFTWEDDAGSVDSSSVESS